MHNNNLLTDTYHFPDNSYLIREYPTDEDDVTTHRSPDRSLNHLDLDC